MAPRVWWWRQPETLVANRAVLVYLVWRKHLFGVGGRPVEEDRVAVVRSG